MPVDVVLPQLGESVSEGTITKILIKEGDWVKKDQPLLEVATDKADSELPSPSDGRVSKIFAKEGETLPVRSILLQLEEGALDTAKTPRADGPGPVVEPVASKANASASGGGSDGRSANSIMASPGLASSDNSAVVAAPSVRRAALEQGISLSDVRGSGERGRVTKDDVLSGTQKETNAGGSSVSYSYPSQAPIKSSAETHPTIPPNMIQQGAHTAPIPGLGYGAFKVPAYRERPGDEVIPFTRRRRITADHMTYSKLTAPHVVTVAEIDLQKTSKLREANKERYKKEGLSLTMLAFVVQSAARALRENPMMNARVLDDSFVILKDINIGVAVDSPDGLVVPVVKRADELGVRGIVRSIDELAKRAKNGKVTIDDLSGATFSITNPGLKGNLFGGAVISQPNVGILRMGEIKKRVVVVEGDDGADLMVVHPVMYMALSYDHRIVDGVAANTFLWRVSEIMEKGDFET